MLNKLAANIEARNGFTHSAGVVSSQKTKDKRQTVGQSDTKHRRTQVNTQRQRPRRFLAPHGHQRRGVR